MTGTDADPAELAQQLEGVITGAEPALTEQEIEYLGEAIGYLRAQADRRDGVRDKLDRAFGEGSP